MSVEHSPQKVACFDVDGTIFRSSLLIELVSVLIERGSFPESTRGVFEKHEHEWIERKGSYESYIAAVVESFMEHLKGLPLTSFEEAADIVIARNQNMVYRFTRDLLKKLKKEGYFLLAISHSPKLLLDKFCAEYGFDKVYGRRYVIGDDAHFTGEVLDPELYMNKAAVLERAVHQEGLTLEDSVGVGDTEGDIPMLSLVTHPTCFNPNSALYTFGREKGWRVIVERKDVIYEIAR